MEKIWYIQVDGTREGPFSFQELKKDLRITPDTLIWKSGFKKWVPIRSVPELKELFKDEPTPDHDIGTKARRKILAKGKDELALDMQRGLPPLFWLLIIAIALLYFLYKLNK